MPVIKSDEFMRIYADTDTHRSIPGNRVIATFKNPDRTSPLAAVSIMFAVWPIPGQIDEPVSVTFQLIPRTGAEVDLAQRLARAGIEPNSHSGELGIDREILRFAGYRDSGFEFADPLLPLWAESRRHSNDEIADRMRRLVSEGLAQPAIIQLYDELYGLMRNGLLRQPLEAKSERLALAGGSVGIGLG